MPTSDIFDLNKIDQPIRDYLAEHKRAAAHFNLLAAVQQTGDVIVHKETVLSIQDTTRDNYPALIKAFFADVNKSAVMLEDALRFANNDRVLSSILKPDALIAGHRIGLMGDWVINADAHKAAEHYFKTSFRSFKLIADAMNRFAERHGPLKRDEKKLYDYLSKTHPPSDGIYLTHMHPSAMGSTLFDALKDFYKKVMPDLSPEAEKAFKFILKTPESQWKAIYYACNLYDEGIIPKKSMVVPIEDSDGKTVSVVFNNACNITRKELTLYGDGEIDCSLAYYLKRTAIEQAVRRPMKEFMSASKDYLARLYYIIESRAGSSFSEKHPFVISTEATMGFEKRMARLRADYDAHFASLQEIVDRKGSPEYRADIARWRSFVERFGRRDPWMLPDGDGTCTASELLRHINRAAAGRAVRYALLKDEDEKKRAAFQSAKREELYIHYTMRRMLDYYYKDTHGQNSDSPSAAIPLFGRRATFHEVKSDSLVFDFRKKDAPPPEQMNDRARKAMRALRDSGLSGKLYDAMRTHPYHDFFELDAEMLAPGAEFGVKELIALLSNTGELHLPVRERCAIKFRRLGQYKASGIYFSHSRTVGLDFRSEKRSYIHEMAHHIDLSGSFRGRARLVRMLTGYFSPRITERRDYYLSGTELIARAAEIGMILISGRYAQYRKKELDAQSMIAAVRKGYEMSAKAKYMLPWDSYAGADEYIDIERCIEMGDFELLDEIHSFFDAFWNNRIRIVDEDEAIASAATAYEGGNRLYKSSHRSYNYYMSEIYDIQYPAFDAKRYAQAAADFLRTEFAEKRAD